MLKALAEGVSRSKQSTAAIVKPVVATKVSSGRPASFRSRLGFRKYQLSTVAKARVAMQGKSGTVQLPSTGTNNLRQVCALCTLYVSTVHVGVGKLH